MFSTRFVSLVLTCAASLVLVQNPACAQVVKPFKISGGGPVPQGLSLIPGDPSLHFAAGQGTDLGRYSCVSLFTLVPGVPPAGATSYFSSAPYCVFVGANGDILTCTYGDVSHGAAKPGVVTLSPAGTGKFTATFVAEFRPVPELSTGKFAKIIEGSWIMYAKSSPFSMVGTKTTPFTYTWEGKGTFTYPKHK